LNEQGGDEIREPMVILRHSLPNVPQRRMAMQYFRPDGNFFVGDCMPFFHDGTFRLYYLVDEAHHEALGGLGGHQWEQASTEDLVHWKHHPLAIPITEEREGSICTGSVFFHKGTYYGLP
jgi:hypothetical protein